jgi:hypothetical protein
MKTTIDLGSFEDLPAQKRLPILRLMMEMLVMVDAAYLAQHPETPPLYEDDGDGGWHLRLQSGGGAVWRDIHSVLVAGQGDVVDFVCWRIAELRIAGYDDVHPHLKMTYAEDGSLKAFTVQVRVNDVIEDPMQLIKRTA